MDDINRCLLHPLYRRQRDSGSGIGSGGGGSGDVSNSKRRRVCVGECGSESEQAQGHQTGAQTELEACFTKIHESSPGCCVEKVRS